MSENKTKPTPESVTAFLKKIADPNRRNDCLALLDLMEVVSKAKPVMWGSSIIGFGIRHYVYESGREGDTVVIGFSPRKDRIAIYLTGGLRHLTDELSQLGKHTTGVGCLYVKSLRDIDSAVLKKMLVKACKLARQK
jgi:hypothetical protein